MARYNDNSCYYKDWTNKKLISELTKTANLETFSDSIFDGNLPNVCGEEASIAIRERTKLYRESWMQPIIEEIERRLIKP
jgi:hypothetical protein